MAPSRISSTSFAVCGLQRYMKASIRKTSLRRAASTTVIVSGAFIVMGFSHRMCLPASAARTAHFACIGCGGEM